MYDQHRSTDATKGDSGKLSNLLKVHMAAVPIASQDCVYKVSFKISVSFCEITHN